MAILGYLTLLSSVAFALWSILLKYNRVGMIAPFNFLIPVSGALLSAIFLGENILELKYSDCVDAGVLRHLVGEQGLPKSRLTSGRVALLLTRPGGLSCPDKTTVLLASEQDRLGRCHFQSSTRLLRHSRSDEFSPSGRFAGC